MQPLVEILRSLVHGVVAALLPSPERERFAGPREVDAPLWSLELGLVQAPAGLALFFVGGLAFMRPATAGQSMFLLENWFSGLSTTHFQGLGVLNWFAWFLVPVSWPFAYLAVVGAARCVAFAATREAVGEPLVWAGLRLVQRVRGKRAQLQREARLGPVRPDRLVTRDGADVTVLACRDKPGWVPGTTVEIEGRFYRLVGVDERPDGAWTALAYRLREQEGGAVIRRLVRYEPPPASSGSRARL